MCCKRVAYVVSCGCKHVFWPAMRIYIDKEGKRSPNWWEAYCLFLVVGAAAYIPFSYAYDMHLPGSPLRELFGVPCPLCGGTRAVTALCLGRFGEAWDYNPLAIFVFFGLLLSIFHWLIALFTRRRIEIESTRIHGRIFWTVIAAIFIANWIYVLAADMWEKPLSV